MIKEKFKQLIRKIEAKWKYVVGFGVPIAILAGVSQFSGYSLKDLWTSNEEQITNEEQVDYFDITVFVHGEEGIHEHILENRGRVVLSLNTDKRDEKIGDKGEVNFKELPASFKNKKVTFYLLDTEGEPYQVANPDSQYVLIPNKPIHIPVVLANLDHIKGTVRDVGSPSKRLSNVKVCIEGVCVDTDVDGRYLLQLPESLQRKFHTVSFRKEGYEEYVKHKVPMQLEGDFDVTLEPIKESL